MVGGYTENYPNHRNSQNRGVGACLDMGACSGLYSITVKMSCAIQTIDGQQRENFCRIHICWLSDLPGSSRVGIIVVVVDVAVGAIQEKSEKVMQG